MVDIILGNVDGFMRMILDHPVIILCMVYDHPELGMIDYHPGMWMVCFNLYFVCGSFIEDDCDHPVIMWVTTLSMV